MPMLMRTKSSGSVRRSFGMDAWDSRQGSSTYELHDPNDTVTLNNLNESTILIYDGDKSTFIRAQYEKRGQRRGGTKRRGVTNFFENSALPVVKDNTDPPPVACLQ